MKSFFKYAALAVLALFLFFLPVLVAVMTGKSALSGFLVSITIVTILLLLLLANAFRQRLREKKFITGLLEQDTPTEGITDKQLSEELSNHWKAAMKELKKSSLKDHGNPLYVLPWYMVIGESGSGKTTALKNSGLTSNAAAPTSVSGLSGTKNCDWWFFEQAIIIDTAGRYALHQDEAADRDEWRLFLSQLAKYRKKEPLNGLIISVSADRLLTASPDDIENDGKKLRIRIEELMQSLGARFPVYVLVTKGDLIYGMKEFCDYLPESTTGQAFGYLNETISDSAEDVVDKAFDSVIEKTGNVRLRMANMPGDESIPPEVLLFPEEFSMLKKGLNHFINGAFSKSVYQEQPFLRGLYFTSARQDGAPHSHFVNDLDFNIDRQSTASEKSFFLFDFFSKVLPSDRSLFELTSNALAWKKKIKMMRLAVWATFIFTLCGFLSWSFGTNLMAIKQFQKNFSKPPVLSGELLTDVNTLENVKSSILNIQRQNEKTWLPGFGLNHSQTIETNLKDVYCRFFNDDFLASYDKQMTEAVVNYSETTPASLLGKTIPHLIKRINLLDASLADTDIETLTALSMPDFRCLVLSEGQQAIPKSFELLERQYLHYLLWADADAKANKMEELKSRLDFIVTKEGISMEWLIAWCNESSGLTPITLSDFWYGNTKAENTAVVRPAFTVKGSGAIDTMMAELEKAMETPLNIEKKKIGFRKSYKEAYINEWFTFGTAFKAGKEGLIKENDKLMTAKLIAAEKGPYLSLLDRMAKELTFDSEQGQEETLPQWVRLVKTFDTVKVYAAQTSGVEKKGVMGKIAKKGLKLFGKAGKLAAGATKTSSSDESPESLMISADGYNRYIKGLDGISKAGVSPFSSFTLASAVFSEDPATGESSVQVAKRGLEDMKIAMLDSTLPQKMVVELLNGPLEYLWEYVCINTGCFIQKSWDEKVLSEIDGVYDAKVLSGMMFGKDGVVNKFAAADIAPFITRSRKKGYYAKTIAGEKIPFDKSFFSFLTRGAYSVQSEKAEYKVTLKGVPTDTNADAKLIPHVTKLELECAEGSQVLENYNYPVSKTFVWSPSGCGDVTLKINIGHLILEKKYSGFRPFAKFLKDFSRGQHTFYPKNFRDKRSALKRMGIKYIKVKYKISGGRPVIRLLNMAAGNAPEVIVKCSD